MPFTELKIDQMFVGNASSRAANRGVLESSLDLARRLGLVAVAEGVENHDDWELPLSLGCPLRQGYYIARPMHAREFDRWLRAGRQALA